MKTEPSSYTITIEVTYQHHTSVVLKNKNGDTFTYNPLRGCGEDLADFIERSK